MWGRASRFGPRPAYQLFGARLDRRLCHRVDDVVHQAPRLRSFTGLARPCGIGPTLITCALRCTALYVVFPVSRSGNIKTLARPATGLLGRLVWPTEATAAASYCRGRRRPARVRVRAQSGWPRRLCRHCCQSPRCRAETDHRDPGLDAEGPGAPGSARGPGARRTTSTCGSASRSPGVGVTSEDLHDVRRSLATHAPGRREPPHGDGGHGNAKGQPGIVHTRTSPSTRSGWSTASS
jgi:hypothetical protein